MSRVPRYLVFAICVGAVILIHRDGHPLLFGFAAAVAFGNLISSQLVCALNGYCSNSNLHPLRDPFYIAFLAHRITSIIGLILLMYALIDLYRQN